MASERQRTQANWLKEPGGFTQFFTALGTRLSPSTASHPQTDGLTERYNRVVLEALRTLVDTDADAWHLRLPCIQFAINNTVHSIMKKSPFQLYAGRDPVIPTDLLSGTLQQAAGSNPLAIETRDTLRYASDLMALEQEMQAERHDKSVTVRTYNPSDLVLVSARKIVPPQLREKFESKLRSRFVGPFPIVKRIGANAYEVDLPTFFRAHRVINVEHIRRFGLNFESILKA